MLVPNLLQSYMLRELHNSHMGIVKTKSLARNYIWWPSLNDDIEKTCKSCHLCLKYQASPEHCALIPWKFPESAWERLHLDFLGPFRQKVF